VKLTDAQKEKLAGIVKKHQEASRRISPPVDFQEYQKQVTGVQQAATDSVTKLLDAGQNKRLGELLLQQAKQEGLYPLLSRPAVVEGLKLNAEQRKRLLELFRGGSMLQFSLDQEFPSSFQNQMPPEITRAVESIHSATEKKLEAVLTKEQKDALRKLLGKPFGGQLPRHTFGGGGGFAGGGGFGPPT
jgi:hypothetical protein